MGDALGGYERGVERFCRELARVGLGFWSGRRPHADAARVYRRHRRLLGPAPVARLRDGLAAASPAAADRRRRLLEFALTETVNARRLPRDARVATIERAVLLRAGGVSVPLGAGAAALAGVVGAEDRRAIAGARERVLAEQVDPELIAARELALGTARELGHPTLASAFTEGSGIDLDQLGLACRGFLARTEAALRDALPALAAAAGIEGPEPLGIADLPRMMREHPAGADVDPTALLAELCAGLGLPAPGAAGIHVDAGARAGKSARGFCVAVEVPGEIHLVIDAGDGQGRATLLHEAGHALHRAHTGADLEVGARRLGDNGVTESWAFLLEGLAGAIGPEPDPGEQQRSRARGLLLVRRHCARLIYELELDRDWGSRPAAAIAGRYAELMSEATGLEWPPAGWLYDLDPAFYSARYIRGWMLAAEWRGELEWRWGRRWFEQAEAGRLLRELWSRGQQLDADRLARAVLGRELGFEALERELAPLSEPAASRSPR